MSVAFLVDRLPPGTWAPADGAAEDRIAALERRTGRPLPPDLRELHSRCRDVSLLDGTYRFLSPDAMQSIAEIQLGDATDDWAPRSWLAIIDLNDGNYVAVDLLPNMDGSHDWLDCDHEVVGEADVIAISVEGFIRRALAHPEGLYWLAPGHRPYRRRKDENPPSLWRKQDAGWFANLGEEVGPEACSSPACDRLRITHSVMCRSHHYEMVQGRPCPFEK